MNQTLNEMEDPEFFIRNLLIQLKLLSKEDFNKRGNGWESLFKTLLYKLEGLTDIKRPIFHHQLNITHNEQSISHKRG